MPDVFRAGIDLGTTNSAIYVVVDGQPVLVLDEHRCDLMPSAVWRSGPETLFGYDALARRGSVPAPILGIKRLMGTNERVRLDGEEKSPPEISALLLAELKRRAEDFVRRTFPDRQVELTEVVITYPARFDAAARKATYDAGLLAGFQIVHLHLEPVAAALAHARRPQGADCGDDHADDDGGPQNLFVFDLGGGTFDVTILDRGTSPPDLLDTGGTEHLGGMNFDERLSVRLLKHLIRQGCDLDHLDPNRPEEKARLDRLAYEAEAIRCNLTGRDRWFHSVPHLMDDRTGRPVALTITVHQSDLEEDTRALLDEVLRHCRDVLARQPFADQKRLSVEDLRSLSQEEIRARARANVPHVECIRVGGASAMSLVEKRLADPSDLNMPSALCDSPFLIVAEGAGLIAASLPQSLRLPFGRDGRSLTLRCPTTTRSSTIVISGGIAGTAGRHKVSLANEAGTEWLQEIVGEAGFTFSVPMEAHRVNHFTVTVTDEQGTIQLEHELVVWWGGDAPPRPILTVPIYIQDARGFFPVFQVNDPLPFVRQLGASTTDASGQVFIPFYEGDGYRDEIVVTGVPSRAGAAVRISAEIDERFHISAQAHAEGGSPARVDFDVRVRTLRSLAEIRTNFDRLSSRLDSELMKLVAGSDKLELGHQRELLGLEIERALEVPEPRREHLEALVARYRMLVDRAVFLNLRRAIDPPPSPPPIGPGPTPPEMRAMGPNVVADDIRDVGGWTAIIESTLARERETRTSANRVSAVEKWAQAEGERTRNLLQELTARQEAWKELGDRDPTILWNQTVTLHRLAEREPCFQPSRIDIQRGG